MKCFQDEQTLIHKLTGETISTGNDPTYQQKRQAIWDLQRLILTSHQVFTRLTWPKELPSSQEPFAEFISKLTDCATLVGSPMSDLFKTYAFISLNGIPYILKKQALNLVSQPEPSSQDGTLPVYTFYNKEIFNCLPPLKTYSREDSSALYSKSFLPHLRDLDLRSRKANITSSRSYGDVNRRTVLSSLMQDSDFSTPGKVIPLKSLSSGQTFDYDPTTYSAAKFRTKQCLAPVLTPIDVYDFESESYIEANFYTFVFNSNIERLKKYVKARKYFSLVLNSLMTLEGAYFYDKDGYQDMLFASSLKRYVPPDCIGFEAIQNFSINSEHAPPVALDHEHFLNLTSEYDYPQELTQVKEGLFKKQSKAKLEFTQIERAISISRHSFDLLKDSRRKIICAEKALKEARDNYLTRQAEAKSSAREVPQTIANFKANIRKTKAYASTRDIVSQQFAKYRSENIKDQNESLKNILKSIEIIEFSFKEKSSNEIHVLNSKNIMGLVNTFASTALFSDSFTLLSFHYCTKLPQPIKVNGSKTNLKVGGPYEIRLTSGGMSIKPASSNSYYVLDYLTETSLKILSHPHSAGSTLRVGSEQFSWESCCLGEVASMLWKAWRDSNIVQIFVLVNLWLCSANSSDTWGRRQHKFLNWSHHQSYQNYLIDRTKRTPTKSTLPLEEASLTSNILAPDQATLPAEASNLPEVIIPTPQLPDGEIIENVSQAYTPYIQTR